MSVCEWVVRETMWLAVCQGQSGDALHFRDCACMQLGAGVLDASSQCLTSSHMYTVAFNVTFWYFRARIPERCYPRNTLTCHQLPL